MREFQEFGNRMQVIAILSIISIVIPAVGIVMLIFIFLALGNIQRIYYERPNPELMEFRSNFILSFVIRVLGAAICILGLVASMMPLFFTNNEQIIMGVFIGFIVSLVVGAIFMVISGYIEYKAWNKLVHYFESNRDMFPEKISKEAINGAKNLKLHSIFEMTIVLTPVGFILRIIGFFHLAALKDIYSKKARSVAQSQEQIYPQAQVPQQVQIPLPIKQKTPNTINSFCPQCGTKIDRDVKFCYFCGAKVLTILPLA